MLFTWILAACLPLALTATSDNDCCPYKVHLGSTYELEKQLDPMDPMYSPNCMNDGCVYIKQGTDMRYCFASGGSEVECIIVTDAPNNPPVTYATTMAPATNMATNSTMTYAPTMAPATNMATNSTMTYAPTTTVQAST